VQSFIKQNNIAITIDNCYCVIVLKIQNYFSMLKYLHTRKEKIVYFMYLKSVILLTTSINIKIRELIYKCIFNIYFS